MGGAIGTMMMEPQSRQVIMLSGKLGRQLTGFGAACSGQVHVAVMPHMCRLCCKHIDVYFDAAIAALLLQYQCTRSWHGQAPPVCYCAALEK